MTVIRLASNDESGLDARAHRPSAQEVIAWAVTRFAGKIVLTCSWQRQSSVLIHMLHELGASIRIVEIDTGLLFPETHIAREALIARYGIEVETILPRQSLAQQAATEGDELWKRNPERCCRLRKVAPFDEALRGMDAWMTGIRREQGPSRSQARHLEWDEVRGVTKVQPLVDWTDEDVMGYLLAHDVPYNELHDYGYPSIGCMPCTRPVIAGGDERSGRWSGHAKTECGLHTPIGSAN